jgi:hypothetical protein
LPFAISPHHHLILYALIVYYKTLELLPHARLSILPGIHGAYIGEVTTGMEHSKIPDLTVSIIEEFLNEPMPKKN